MKGLVHIYCGSGKGKTTAAAGLALRCAGSGGKVVFYQFLKDGRSSEIAVLKKIPGITVIDGPDEMKFTFQMTDEEKRALAKRFLEDLEKIRAEAEDAAMAVLDEALDAVNLGFLPLEKLTGFIDGRSEATEVVLTGRDPAAELCERADYITDMQKIKHPYDLGIKARPGIEL